MANILEVITNILKLLYKIIERLCILITNVIVNGLVPMLVMAVLVISLINVIQFLVYRTSIIVFIGSLIVLGLIPWYSSYLQKWLRGE